MDQLDIVGVEFACRALHVFQQACLQCGAAAGERLQYEATFRSDETDKPAHEFDRFDRRMEDAVGWRMPSTFGRSDGEAFGQYLKTG